MAAHKWHKEICAWAEGKAIQYNSRFMWEDFDPKYDPNWNASGIQWRIKPTEEDREYPRCSLSQARLAELRGPDYDQRPLTMIINDVLREMCDSGEIFTKAEFDRATGKNK